MAALSAAHEDLLKGDLCPVGLWARHHVRMLGFPQDMVGLEDDSSVAGVKELEVPVILIIGTSMEVHADSDTATILCASDPYAVVGVVEAFGMKPDLVSGRSTSTEAGIRLIDKLVGVPAMNLFDPGSGPELRKLLGEWLKD
jgi:hypothetical protein